MEAANECMKTELEQISGRYTWRGRRNLTPNPSPQERGARKKTYTDLKTALTIALEAETVERATRYAAQTGQ